MKQIRVQVSGDSNESVASLDEQIPIKIKDTPGFDPFYQQAITCIQDFSRRTKNLTAGTTINLKREILFSDLRIVIILDYPKKQSLFDKIKSVLGRG